MRLTDFSEYQIKMIKLQADKYGIATDRVVSILSDIYNANFDEDLKTVDEHLAEVKE